MAGREGIPGYALDNLSLNEQIELLSLIRESRTIPVQGIQRVVIKERKIEIDVNGNRQVVEHIHNIDRVETHDVTFEEMPVSPLKKFKDITPKEKKEEIKSNVIDARPKRLPKPQSTEAITQRIHEGVLEKLKKKLKK